LEEKRKRVLTFLEARQLAGEKWTAQAISEKLDIPIKIAQIAVLNPIGRNVKVPKPDIATLYKGMMVAQMAGDFSSDNFVDCGLLTGLCEVVVGGIIIAGAVPVKAAIDLWNHFFPSKSNDKDVPIDDGDAPNKDRERAAVKLPNLTGKTRQEAENTLHKLD
jgi:hypothetical protein